ncbi:hypothetical protein BJ742DRAFT_794955 [Cladochytrium replicatum]|nr:hypothetical protein BJ742DRAFT_794955 [Cladochytrium replicatum]
MSSILLLVFVPFSFFVSLVHFNPTPTSKSVQARLSARLELLEMLQKTVLCLATVLAPSSLVVRMVLIIGCSSLQILYIIVFLPYYRMTMNLVKSQISAQIMWVGLVGLIVVSSNTIYGEYFFYGWVVGDVLLILSSYFIFKRLYRAHSRALYKRLMGLVSQSRSRLYLDQQNPMLSNRNIPMDEERGIGIQRTLHRPSAVSVLGSFNTPHGNGQSRPSQGDPEANDQNIMFIETILEALQSHRFLSPVSVELATRFLVETNQPTKDELCVAEAIFLHGLNVYSDKAIMHLQAGIFYGLYMKSQEKWKLYLQNANGLNAPLDVELAIRLSDIERRRKQSEKNGEQNLDMVDELELKLQLKVVTRINRDLIDQNVQLWRSLIIGKSNIGSNSKFERIVQKMTGCELVAGKVYKNLFARFPGHLELLDAYGSFLEVTENFAMADEIYQQLEQLMPMDETGMSAYFPTNHNEGRKLDGGDDGDSASRHSSEPNQSKPISHRFFTGSMQSFTKSLSGSSSIASSLARRRGRVYTKAQVRLRKAHRMLVEGINSAKIFRLKVIIRVFVAIIISLVIGQMAWTISATQDALYRVDDIALSGFRREFAVDVPLRLRAMQDAARNNDTETFFGNQQHILNGMKTMFNIQNRLFFSADQSKGSYQLWLQPWINLQFYLPGNVTERYWSNPLNLYDSTSEFWRHGRGAVNRSVQEFADPNLTEDFHYRFCMDNLPFVYADAYNTATTLYTDENESEFRLLLTSMLIGLGALGGALFVSAIVLFRPAIQSIKNESVTSLNALLEIPKDIIEEQYSKVLQMKAIWLNSKVPVPGEKPEEGATEEANDMDTDDGSEEVAFVQGQLLNVATYKNQNGLASVNLQWSVSLVLIMIIALACVMVAYSELSRMLTMGRRLDLTQKISYITMRLAYASQELALKDISPLFSEQTLRKHMLDDLLMFNSIQFGLLFGDAGGEAFGLLPIGLPVQRLPLELNETMFFPRWGTPPASTDELVNQMLQNVAVLQRTVNITRDNGDLRNILHIYGFISAGFAVAASVNGSILQAKINMCMFLSKITASIGIILIVVIYIYAFQRIFRLFDEEHIRVQSILCRIPPEIVDRNLSFQTLRLDDRKLAAELVNDVIRNNAENADCDRLPARNDGTERTDAQTPSASRVSGIISFLQRIWPVGGMVQNTASLKSEASSTGIKTKILIKNGSSSDKEGADLKKLNEVHPKILMSNQYSIDEDDLVTATSRMECSDNSRMIFDANDVETDELELGAFDSLEGNSLESNIADGQSGFENQNANSTILASKSSLLDTLQRGRKKHKSVGFSENVNAQ